MVVVFCIVREDNGDILYLKQRKLPLKLCRKPQVVAVKERDVPSAGGVDSDVARGGGQDFGVRTAQARREGVLDNRPRLIEGVSDANHSGADS